MQNIFGSHMPKKTFLHTSRVPLLNWRRPETCKTKQNSSTCHAHFLQENHASRRSKQKRLFGFGCSMRHAKQTNMLRGSFRPARTAAKMAFASSLLYTPVCCPVDIVHPCMFLTFAPTKTPCEQIAKTS